MIGLALFAATAVAPAQQSAPQEPLVRQATATVRILSGAVITAGEMPPEALVKTTEVEDADGSKSAALLVEFQ